MAHVLPTFIRPPLHGACLRRVRRLALAASFAVLSLLAVACNPFQATGDPTLTLDFAGTLPENWTPIDTWRDVNIDGDDEPEYLLFYTFDQGLVGGAIYDAQFSPDLVGVVEVSATPVATPTVTLVPVPLQPLAYYRPYRVLPASWSYAYGGNVGHGYFARSGDENSVLTYEVTQQPLDDQAAAEADLPMQPPAELVVYGDQTHLTFVWWLNEVHGYASTQLNAAGGFADFDWGTTSSTGERITEISGLDPLTDYRARSQLCRETHYTRVADATHDFVSITDTPTIEFASEDQGITFCRDAEPAHPYYPEGVVMKYLTLTSDIEEGDADLDENDEQLTWLLTPTVAGGSIQWRSDPIRHTEEMISDIAAYPTVPALPPRIVTGDFLPTTTVCVEATPREGTGSPRWILYTLQYQPPDLDQGMADRWTISGAEEMPALADNQTPYQCESLLNATLD